ncbi:unnamed protein product [Prunus armeniaca]|uniref:LOB domain-containing protein n=1 Tax=Prunus armeniaca TaxID=36596 RepID=A0A6J5W510_PRUAR|nr:unnamed protein product [Prunus armeniaca]
MKHQTCAACRFQRKKCTQDCLMAPYFPATRFQQFLNAHKLFGVGKITKTLNSVSPQQRSSAMYSVKAEAEYRSRDPVGGCYNEIKSLLWKIRTTEDELQHVHSQLCMFRAGGENAMAHPLEGYEYNVVQDVEYDSQLHHQLQQNTVQEQSGVVENHQEQSNVFDLRDEVVLEQDVNPIQDEGPVIHNSTSQLQSGKR